MTNVIWLSKDNCTPMNSKEQFRARKTLLPIHTLIELDYFRLFIVFYSQHATVSKHILTLYCPLYGLLYNEQE